MQLALNLAWSPVFFGLQKPREALFLLLGLALAVVWTTALFWRLDPLSGQLMLPYVAWLAVAASLNYTIVKNLRITQAAA